MSRAALARNVIIWDLNNNEDRIPLGGLNLASGLTNKDFHQMLDILLVISADSVVLNEHGDEILRDNQPLLPGDYIVAADEVAVSLYRLPMYLSICRYLCQYCSDPPLLTIH